MKRFLRKLRGKSKIHHTFPELEDDAPETPCFTDPSLSVRYNKTFGPPVVQLPMKAPAGTDFRPVFHISAVSGSSVQFPGPLIRAVAAPVVQQQPTAAQRQQQPTAAQRQQQQAEAAPAASSLPAPLQTARSLPAKPQPAKPQDNLKRLAKVVTLYHELQREGRVANAVGWQQPPATAAAATASMPALALPKLAPIRTRVPARIPGASPAPQAPKVAASPAEQQQEQCSEALSGAQQAERAAEVAAFQPASLQQVSSFVSALQAKGLPAAAASGGCSKGADGGAAPAGSPRGAETAAEGEEAGGAWAAKKWAALVEAAELHAALRDSTARLRLWRVDVQAGTVSEALRLVAQLESAAALVGRAANPQDPARQCLATAEVPWKEGLVVELRSAAQNAAVALLAAALDEAQALPRLRRLQPLGHAVAVAFKAQQFSGGLSPACAALFDQVAELTVQQARLIDPHWLGSARRRG